MSHTVTIITAGPEDAGQIFEVQYKTWLATYPNSDAGVSASDIKLRFEGLSGEKRIVKIDRRRRMLETQDSTHATFVAKVDGKIVGFVDPVTNDGKHRVGALYVLPEFQGMGIGGMLLQKALEWHGKTDDVFLNVVSYNQQAIGFYEKFGFRKTGRTFTDQESGVAEFEMILAVKASN